MKIVLTNWKGAPHSLRKGLFVVQVLVSWSLFTSARGQVFDESTPHYKRMTFTCLSRLILFGKVPLIWKGSAFNEL